MRGNNTTARLWALLALVSLTTLANATQAAEAADSLSPPHKVVSFKDLNLTSAEGVALLYGRIRSAAVEVCGVGDQRELARVVAATDCIDKAVSRAIVAVNSPSLTNLYLAKTWKTEKQLIAQVR
jgi:UrcA family protein